MAARMLRPLCRTSWANAIAQPELRRHFWSTVLNSVRHNPSALEFVLILTSFCLRLGRFSCHVMTEIDRQIIEARTLARDDGPMLPGLYVPKSTELEGVTWH